MHEHDDLRSLRERLAALPVEQRAVFLAGLPPEVLAAPPTTGPSGRGPTNSSRRAVAHLADAQRPRRRQDAGRGRMGARQGRERHLWTPAPRGAHRRRRARDHGRGALGTAHHQPARLSAPSIARGCGASSGRTGPGLPLLGRGTRPPARPPVRGRLVRRAGQLEVPEAYQNLLFGLRLGSDPRCVITSTPRPTRLIREIIAQPTTVQTQSSTYANRFNLAPAFLNRSSPTTRALASAARRSTARCSRTCPGRCGTTSVSMSCGSRRPLRSQADRGGRRSCGEQLRGGRRDRHRGGRARRGRAGLRAGRPLGSPRAQ